MSDAKDNGKIDEAQRMVDEARAKRAANAAPPVVTEAVPGESGPFKHERGAQVILTGPARAAARGATHGEIAHNTAARDAAIAGGHVSHSSMPDMDTKPPEHAVAAALGEDPSLPTVPEAERQLEIAREREASRKERVETMAPRTEPVTPAA